MKHLKFSIIVLGLAMTACTDSGPMDVLGNFDAFEPIVESGTTNRVSLNNIQRLLKTDSISTRGNKMGEMNIECLTNSKNDTLLYVHKKLEGGWTIYSSDTRIPPIIAESDNGSFDELMEVEAAKMWIDAMVEDMNMVRYDKDEELKFTKEEITRSKNFWRSIAAPNEFMIEHLVENGLVSKNGLEKPEWPGHYEFTNSITYTEVIEEKERFTNTNWNQLSPYNSFCPYKSDYSDRAPAGCVAIAGAQVLYYMHYKIGIPYTAPSEAYCYGNVNSKDYNWSQYNHNSTIWDEMNKNGEKAAPFIAEIGRLVKMKYGDEASGTHDEDLKETIKYYGIPCDLLDYNTNIDKLKINLLLEVPVILGANRYDSENRKYIGHSFYTDSYRRVQTVTANYYTWVFDSTPPDDIFIELPPDKVTYVYSSPDIDMIGINWGEGAKYNQPQVKTWYSLTGDWIPIGSNMNFIFSRNMIIM